jgi:hypothetical protein
VFRAAAAIKEEADPEQTIFGSARRETRKGYDNQPIHKIILNVIFIINYKIISDMMFSKCDVNYTKYDF